MAKIRIKRTKQNRKGREKGENREGKIKMKRGKKSNLKKGSEEENKRKRQEQHEKKGKGKKCKPSKYE